MSYRGSPLSVEGTPRRRCGPRAGDRLPDTARHARTGAASGCTSCSPGPACTCCSTATRTGSRTWRPAGSSTVHRLTSAPGRGVTVVRPDGYIGFRAGTAEAGQLAAWLALVGAATGLRDHTSPGRLRASE